MFRPKYHFGPIRYLSLRSFCVKFGANSTSPKRVYLLQNRKKNTVKAIYSLLRSESEMYKPRPIIIYKITNSFPIIYNNKNGGVATVLWVDHWFEDVILNLISMIIH